MKQHPLSHGTRIVWRGERGKLGEKGYRCGSWVIREGPKEKRLGLAEHQRDEAERELAAYIAGKEAAAKTAERLATGAALPPEEFLIADGLAYYGEVHAPETADPARIGYAMQALLPYWGAKTVSQINEQTCREYARQRRDEGVGNGTIRRELGIMRAALNRCRRMGNLTSVPFMVLPKKPAPRDRWLTRDEVAKLLWAARRRPKARHLVRFILMGVYTGTRGGAIKRLRWKRSLAGGYVDIENGVLYRRAPRDPESRKRQPPIRIAHRLLRHMRIWRAQDERFCDERGIEIDSLTIVHWYGRPCAAIRTAWDTICEEVGLDTDPDVVAHILRHTAITWAAQNGAEPNEMCGYFGISMEEMQRTYLHHHPDYQSSVVSAFERSRHAR